MLRLYGCLVEQHDLRLVALAAVICVFSSALAVEMIARARQARESRAVWSTLAVATFGAGVWATHFVAELAYDPGLPLGYALGLTGLSIAVAVAAAALGICVALRYGAPLSGGALLGGAVGAMHYVGMAALRVPASVHWDVTDVLFSLTAGMLLSAAALQALWSGTRLGHRLAAVALMVAAIVGLHFTGMTALTLTPERAVDMPDVIVAPKLLALAIAAVTAAIMALGLAGLILGTRFAHRVAEEAERLRRSEARLVDAIEALPAGLAIYDAQDRFVLCNSRYRALYAKCADLMKPEASFAAIVRGGAERGHYKLDERGVEGWLSDRLARWENLGVPFEQQFASGEWIRVTDRRTSDGGIIGLREDITALKQREVTFRALFASNPLPMMVYDVGTLRFLEVNDAAIGHYGYGRDEFLTMTLAQLLAPDEPGRSDKPALDTGPCALRHRKADGSTITVEVTSHQLTFEERSAALMVAIDVTDKRRAGDLARESAVRLSKSERHLARAQELAEVGSFEGNLRTGEIVWSDNLYRLGGLDKESFAVDRESVLSLIHPEDRESYIAWINLVSRGGDVPALAHRIVRPNGECRHHIIAAEPLRDDSGAAVGVFGTVRDVTAARQAEEQRRALEAQLQHSQRLEALGTLAGGVAHDLNNTLVPVVALSKMAMKRLPEDSRDHANMATVLRAGERARDLVRQILAFSRKEAPTRQLVDVAALLRESLRMVRASIQSTITFEEMIEDVPPVHGDPSQIHQIIVNLVVNAAQAIGAAMGTITVRLTPDPVMRLAEVAEGPRRPAVRLTVRDTGCGMEEATMRRIFEPFFTTKPVGEGTGLGLSVVHGIVAQHGGRMAVDSRLGEGTIFEVHLPAAADKADRSAA